MLLIAYRECMYAMRSYYMKTWTKYLLHYKLKWVYM
jgi:hypothetical protein